MEHVALAVVVGKTWSVGRLAFGLAGTSRVLDISDIIQFLVHDKSSSVSQLVKGKSRNLRKLLKHANGTTKQQQSKSTILLSAGVLPVIFVLYSKDLLVVVLLLFIL